MRFATFALILLLLPGCGAIVLSAPDEVVSAAEDAFSSGSALGVTAAGLTELATAETPEGAAKKERLRQATANVLDDFASNMEVVVEYLVSIGLFGSKAEADEFFQTIQATVRTLRGN